MAKDSRWCVLSAAQESDDGSGGDTEGSEGEATSGQPAATLVVFHLSQVAAAKERLKRQAAAKGRDSGPLLAVLLLPGHAESPEQRASAVQAHKECFASGADDVLAAYTTELAALPLAVDVAVVRVEAKKAAERALQRRLAEVCQAEVQRKLEVVAKSEPTDGLFWQSVHKVFQKFPRLAWDVDEDPGEGSWVGPRKLEKRVGQGGFGEVYTAQNIETGEREAVKIISKEGFSETKQVANLWREMHLLKTLAHPNIVNCYESFHGPGHVFICMEFAGKTTLSRTISGAPKGRLTMSKSRYFQSQLFSALAHCEEHGVAHRDIKPENIAVCAPAEGSEPMLKVLDFGTCAPLERPCCDMAGTMPFMSPEILAGGDVDPYLPRGSDVWSAGVVLMEMACGYGKLNQMLSWTSRSEPCPDRFDELDRYFADEQRMFNSLEQDLGDLGDDLKDLLAGTFRLSLEDRWSAREATDCKWLAAG